MRKTIELLAPAGDLARLKTAVRYGADAVYLGGKRFSLRSRASNFEIEDIAEGVRLGLQVQNLFTFTKYSGLDVTTGGAFNYPLPRTYMFNLSLGF